MSVVEFVAWNLPPVSVWWLPKCGLQVERHLRKLDQEVAKFKMELEADNAGITEILEKRECHDHFTAHTCDINVFKFGEISDNILEMVRRGDTVAMED